VNFVPFFGYNKFQISPLKNGIFDKFQVSINQQLVTRNPFSLTSGLVFYKQYTAIGTITESASSFNPKRGKEDLKWFMVT